MPKDLRKNTALDYEETFAPVVRFESVRTLIALSAKYGLRLEQLDVTTAFLNGELEQEIYMSQPEGFVVPGKENYVCKLKRSIYGLKQSPRCWNETVHTFLSDNNFRQADSDPCIYVNREDYGSILIVAVYVDDIIVASKTDSQIGKFKTLIGDRFKIKDLGLLNYFLGVTVDQRTDGSIFIGQKSYTNALLEKYSMTDCKPVGTPVSTDVKLTLSTDGQKPADTRLYQSAVGSLLHLSLRTRPDISFAVSLVAKFASSPTTEHWSAVKRIFRYLKGTVNLGLQYFPSKNEECEGFADASWADDVDDRKSTSGYVFKLSGAPITWKSKKQTSVALSTAEAEYLSLAAAVQEAVWLRHLLEDFDKPLQSPMVIHEDNQATISMTKNPQFHGRAKHMELRFHFVRQHICSNNVELIYCPSEENIADLFTKSLALDKHQYFRTLLGMRSSNVI